MEEVLVLRWLHIIAMVYWLGGEWGVFQTSYNVINRNLSLEERRRHMETAYRIDILARTGIIMLLPAGPAVPGQGPGKLRQGPDPQRGYARPVCL